MKRSFALALVLAALGAASAQAATIDVTTTNDLTANDGKCSVREALQSAAQNLPSGAAPGECPAGSDADVVAVPAGEYVLSLAFFITSDVTVSGAGAETTVFRPAGPGPIASISGSLTDVTFRGVTLTGAHRNPSTPGGNTSGGNAGGGDGAPGADGGAIASTATGELVLDRVVVSDNDAGAGGPGGTGTGGAASAGADNCVTPGSGIGGQGGRGGNGGGVAHAGAVIVRDSIFSDNHGGTGGAGGNGVGGAAAATTNSFTGCPGGSGFGRQGAAGGDGGAIYALGAVTIERSSFSGNSAGAGGHGGTGTGGSGAPQGPAGGFAGVGGQGSGGNGGQGGWGGAISIGHTTGTPPAVRISDTTFADGGAGSGGAGGAGVGGPGGDSPQIGWFGGTGKGGNGGHGGYGGVMGGDGHFDLELEGGLLTGNRSGSGATGGPGTGGVGGDGGASGGRDGGTGTGGDGGLGGLGAAVTGTGAAAISNTTVTLNVGGDGGAGGHGAGGTGGTPGGTGGAGQAGDGSRNGGAAIYNLTGEMHLRHATVAFNEAGAGGAAGTAAPGAGSGNYGVVAGSAGPAELPGGLINGSGDFILAATIVAANQGNCEPGNHPSTSVTGGTGVIRFGDETCPGTTADPLLAPLADNGGPTLSLALGAASPARDFVAENCAATDQRGVVRSAPCDAGAYEAAAPAVTTGDATGVSQSGATLNGSVAPWFGAPSYRFEYGPTDAYGSSTEVVALGGGLAATDVAATIGGLAPGATYHYRLVAENSDGAAFGADRTFTTTPADGGPGGGDTTAPVITSAALKPRRFRAKKGTTISYSLSEAARVVFTVQRAGPGRKVKGRCVRPKRSNRSKPRCRRWIASGRMTVDAVAGANVRKLVGRAGNSRLRRGRHRVTLVATDAAGNASAPKRLTFRVRR